MKPSHSFKLFLALIIISLISCSAIKFTKDSPTERLITAIQKGQNFYSNGETFEGDILLDLIVNSSNKHSTYITSELVFEGCTFTGMVSLKPEESKSLYFNKEIIFEGCEFTNEFIINDATFNARLQIGGTLFRHSLDLRRNNYINICRVDENEIAQDLILQYSKFHEDLSLLGNSLGRHLLLQGISVTGKTQLSNTTLHGSIDVSNSHFHENFNLDYAKKGKKILAGNSKYYSTFSIKSIADFKHIDLSSSDIYGKYTFSSNYEIIPITKNTNFHLQLK